MIDRDQLREALDIVNNGSRPEDLDLWPYRVTPLEVIEQAARLVADPDTLTITKSRLRSVLWPAIMDAYHFEDDDPDDIADAEDMLAALLDALLEGQPK